MEDKDQSKIVTMYGWSGSVSVLVAYGLTTLYDDHDQIEIWIHLLNMYGSSAIGYVCYRGKVWSACLLEVAWFIISGCSLIL